MKQELTKPRAYQSWNAAHTPDHTTAPNTPGYPAPSLALESYLQVNNNNSTSDLHSTAPSITMPAPHLPIRQQYAYHPPPPVPNPANDRLRFIDSNPRPAKSPRHTAAPEVLSHSSNNYSEYGSRYMPPYSVSIGNEAMPSRAPEYFPPTQAQIQSWTSGPDTGVVYGTSQAPDVHHYEFPSEQQYKEDNASQQPHYTWNHA